ncbi:MAG: hypothetical protein HOL66_16235 [Rhodospirillaceae bacterium]|nr:hypothetical protein [Rhodospirillaceae bacterium]MBT5245784.1 hypothetical protein [Rhodospirillaceae bacterium]MBT5561627.1 hypothetical protein [Rhodospirillaceae bacterium]MBT6241777.1 hypothetical protein [Rhodospirillaceae bacterium]MBT7136777.1 hypothetical protein [Rhodospirillaceae bacterium]
MPIPEKSDWPKTDDGTTDWETLFEDEEAGLIALVLTSTSPEQLKERAVNIIQAIFTRKPDTKIISKVMVYLNKLIPEDADGERLATMKSGVQQMLRKVKDDRIKKAAAYVQKKAAKKKKGNPKKKVNRRGSAVGDFIHRNNTLVSILVVALGVLVPLGIYLGSPKEQVAGGNVNEHIGWIDNYVYNHLPQDTWVLTAVKQTKTSQIGIEILITDPDHIAAIHAMKRIARVAVLNQVCPPAGSGVESILEQGWSLWVTLKSSDETLTGGTCHYAD